VRVARRAEAELAGIARRAQVAQRNERTLRERNELVTRVRTFARRRVPAFDVIAMLTDLLPDSTAVVSLHIDSASVTAVLLARHATEAIAELQSQPALGTVEIAGPVTREGMAVGEMERVTVRIRLARGTAPRARPSSPAAIGAIAAKQAPSIPPSPSVAAGGM
jgi:hypothetical protein